MSTFPAEDMLVFINKTLGKEFFMLSLLVDRFLKWFTGGCKRTLSLPNSLTEELDIEPEEDQAVDSDNRTAVRDAALPIPTTGSRKLPPRRP